jgi:hypothetical protein
VDSDVTDSDSLVGDLVVYRSGPSPCSPKDPESPYFEMRQGVSVPADVPFVVGAGLAIADLDGDGPPEFVLVNQREVRIHRPLDEEGGEGQVLLTIEEDHERHGLFGATAVDYDGDADFDLFITRYHGPNILLANDGTGQFTDVTEAAGVAGPDLHWSASASWADFDLDGDLDLAVAGSGEVSEENTVEDIPLFGAGDPTLLYTNQGDGTFADAQHLIGASSHDAYSFVAGFHDLNQDMVPDLYLANDFASKLQPSHGLIQQDGVFVREASPEGLVSTTIGMGLAIDDINGDGIHDLMLPGWNDLALIISQPDGWYDFSQAAAVEPDNDRKQRVAWGSDFGDLNNDGRLDLLVTFGFIDSLGARNRLKQPDSAYFQTDDMVFEDKGALIGLDQVESGRSLIITDLNDDGWLDVAKASTDASAKVFLAACHENAWTRIHLRQGGMNRFAIGARLRATTGDLTQTRYIVAGGHSYGASRPPDAHMGMGDAEVIDRLEITWPDGRVDVLEDMPTREIVTISRTD